MQTITQFLPLILLIFIMYFLLIRPQKKREKSINQMRNSVKVGDEVITIGGICGKIVKTKDDSLVIQVGADKVKFEIMRWAISKVVETGKSPKAKRVVEEEDFEEEAPKKSLPKRMLRKSEKTEAAEVQEPAVPENVVEAEVVTEAEVPPQEEENK